MNSEQYIFTVVKSCNYPKCCVLQPVQYVVSTLSILRWEGFPFLPKISYLRNAIKMM